MRRIAFLPEAYQDFLLWSREHNKIYRKIVELLHDIERDPFSGLGKPEPLRHELKGLWSRRITREHRLVYRVSDDQIVVVSCRFHYE